MIQPDAKVLQALCNLVDSSDFKTIRQWFLDSEAHQVTLLRSSESATVVYRAQGASTELLDFCRLSANPKEIAGKIRQKKAGIVTTIP